MAAVWDDAADGVLAGLLPELAPGLVPELHAAAVTARIIPAAKPGTVLRAERLPRQARC
jgi:hypothetical protein